MTTQKRCMVLDCCSSGVEEGINFFQVTAARQEAWLKVLRRENEPLSPHNYVCSKHFLEDDLVNKFKKQYLRKGAVPVLLITNPGPVPKHYEPLLAGLETKNKENNSVTANLCNPSTSLETITFDKIGIELDDFATCSTDTDAESVNLKRKLPSSSDSIGLKGTPKKARRSVKFVHTYCKTTESVDKNKKVAQEKLISERKKLKAMRQRERRLRKKVEHLKDVVKVLKNKKVLSESAEEVLEQSFSGVSEDLMKRMLEKNKKGKKNKKLVKAYPEVLKTFAMTLQFYSSKAYNFVRETFDLVLPAPSTIRLWLSNFSTSPGFTQQSFDAIQAKVQENELVDKKVVLSIIIDEMHLKKHLELDRTKAAKVWGYVDFGAGIQSDEMKCATQAFVILAVAVNDSWKIPLGFFFIESMTGKEKANLVQEAIKKVRKTGAIVISLTCDGPNAHFTMANQLGAVIKESVFREKREEFKTYFTVTNDDDLPEDEEHQNIFFFFDPCHMLKLVRNNWAKHGIFKYGNDEIDFKYINMLYDLQKQEGLRFGTKLSKGHMDWEKHKMKVKYAAQTLSKSVAEALLFLKDDIKISEFQGATPTINFILIINELFDWLNSRNPCGYGSCSPMKFQNEHKWRPFLTSTADYLANLKNKNDQLLITTVNKTPFLGFITSIMSAIGVFDFYVKSSLLRYFLTYKISQDHIELFFCRVRSKNGWNNNPTCLQFRDTYKRLLFKHSLRVVGGNCNPMDCTSLLPIQTEDVISSITESDITFMKKYNLDESIFSDLTEPELDHNYTLPVKLNLLSRNVATFISGFVVRSLKTKIKCHECLSKLEYMTQDYIYDDNFFLTLRKDRGGNQGGLIKPSPSVKQLK